MGRGTEAAAQRFFDRWAARFETDRMRRWFRYAQGRVLERVAQVGAGDLLDVGCGTGWLVREARRRWPKRRAVGLDLSAAMAQAAHRLALREHGPALFLQGTSRALPFRPASFDWLTCTASAHHYPEPEAVFRRWRAVLRPGGRVLLLESCTRFWPTWVYDRVLRLWEAGHVGYRTGEAWAALLAAAGYTPVAILWRERGFFRHGKVCSSLVLVEAVVPD